jgi:hypothetical protein
MGHPARARAVGMLLDYCATCPDVWCVARPSLLLFFSFFSFFSSSLCFVARADRSAFNFRKFSLVFRRVTSRKAIATHWKENFPPAPPAPVQVRANKHRLCCHPFKNEYEVQINTLML